MPDDQKATVKTKTIAGGGTAATATRSYSQILCNCIASSGAYGAGLRRQAAVHLGPADVPDFYSARCIVRRVAWDRVVCMLARISQRGRLPLFDHDSADH